MPFWNRYYFITGSVPYSREVKCRPGNRTRHYQTLHWGWGIAVHRTVKDTVVICGRGGDKKKEILLPFISYPQKKVLFSVYEYELKSIILSMGFSKGIKSEGSDNYFMSLVYNFMVCSWNCDFA